MLLWSVYVPVVSKISANVISGISCALIEGVFKKITSRRYLIHFQNQLTLTIFIALASKPILKWGTPADYKGAWTRPGGLTRVFIERVPLR